jgi:alginate O-acetyltransferase complex protein AlgI
LIFNTPWFLLFFPLVYAAFWALPGARLRFYFILLSSAVFHFHFAGPAGVAPIVVIGVTTFLFGLALEGVAERPVLRRGIFLVAISIPVLALVSYKYRLLLLDSLSHLGIVPVSLRAASAPALPLAISFFAFEFVHYLVDVYGGDAPIRNPFRFALFAIFFPSIVSGPIKRFQPFLAQMREGLRRPSAGDVLLGFSQVLLGFFKKLVVGDGAAMVIGLLQPQATTRAAVCVLMVLLSIRILFDFSGYSDIAIGLGRMFGIQLPPNFRFPYIAPNPAEFWRRWHMSLSTWIRDYIYVPLGGNRHGQLRRLLNLSVAMFLCGLWHGAEWHFGAWGLYHGLGLAAHNVWTRTQVAERFGRLPASRLASIAANNVFVAYGWLVFFYPLTTVEQFTRVLIGG